LFADEATALCAHSQDEHLAELVVTGEFGQLLVGELEGLRILLLNAEVVLVRPAQDLGV